MDSFDSEGNEPGAPADVRHDSTEPEAGDAAAAAQAKARRRRRARNEWIVLVVLTLVGTFLIRTYVVQSYRIPSGSMEQTLHGGCDPHCGKDRILVNKLAYKLHGIHHGDIVVFKATDPRWIEAVGGPEDIVKRVIGLPGDMVSCCDANGHVVRNGKSLNEPYVFQDDHKKFGPIKVPKGELWVMGDHRSDSSDSRYNGFVPESSVVGHAFMRIWPISRIGFL
ncbi:MAG TPA: signal peptidase I [Acidothermaceae bacterium]|nr:signal peptidase I [Acidothermaceae bacterium]